MYISNYSMLAYIAMFKAINEMNVVVFFTLNLKQIVSKQLMVNNIIA